MSKTLASLILGITFLVGISSMTGTVSAKSQNGVVISKTKLNRAPVYHTTSNVIYTSTKLNHRWEKVQYNHYYQFPGIKHSNIYLGHKARIKKNGHIRTYVRFYYDWFADDGGWTWIGHVKKGQAPAKRLTAKQAHLKNGHIKGMPADLKVRSSTVAIDPDTPGYGYSYQARLTGGNMVYWLPKKPQYVFEMIPQTHLYSQAPNLTNSTHHWIRYALKDPKVGPYDDNPNSKSGVTYIKNYKNMDFSYKDGSDQDLTPYHQASNVFANDFSGRLFGHQDANGALYYNWKHKTVLADLNIVEVWKPFA